ncbi:hypothetical protein FGO68_gene937 [Halteria grandinella]|uniref:Uncharacterized protein n=1 Tax=Halteria grandinella TaxID=5974 RepID=A0A8J8NP85_HALGN|nr:hypothetical protein FGO68_gene937 [Halteria grandinella]
MRERKRILTATVGIILSILVRISLNILNQQDSIIEALDQSILDSTWLYPLYQFFFQLVASIFPITSITYSLLYMVTHRRNMIEVEIYHHSTVVSRGLSANSPNNKSVLQRAGTALSNATDNARDQFLELLNFEENLEECQDNAKRRVTTQIMLEISESTVYSTAKLCPTDNHQLKKGPTAEQDQLIFYRHGKKYTVGQNGRYQSVISDGASSYCGGGAGSFDN